MAAKDRARGKAFERWVGRKLGGRRRLAYERGTADCEDVPFAVEAKSGYGKPQLPAAWIQQAERHAAQENLPWILVQRPKGWRDPLVTMRFSTLLQLTNQQEGRGEDLQEDEGTSRLL